MNKAIELITEERNRQITEEGFLAIDDDRYTKDELAKAAACYAIPFEMRRRLVRHTVCDLVDFMWPWFESWWKPSPDDRIRELVKAGALIVAEIERLQRQNEPN